MINKTVFPVCSIITFIFFCLFPISCFNSTEDTGMPVISDNDFEAVMSGLGIKIDPPARMDANYNTLRSDYNPFSSKRKILIKNSELYIVGASDNKDYCDSLIDMGGTGTSYSVITRDPDCSWNGETVPGILKTAAGDTDGDGHDEIVNAVFNISGNKLILKETEFISDNDSYSHNTIATISDNSITSPDTDEYRCCIDTGDIDGDGYDEILITYNDTLKIFDDKKADYKEMLTKKYTSVHAGYKQFMRVKSADFDCDGKNEIILTRFSNSPSGKAQYYIYDDIVTSPALEKILKNGEVCAIPGEDKYTLKSANMAIGDFNNDRIPDVAFNGIGNSGLNQAYLLILTTTMDSVSKPVFTFLPSKEQFYDFLELSSDRPFFPMDAGDIRKENGKAGKDGNDEIVVFNKAYYLDVTGSLKLISNYNQLTFPHCDSLKIGDINGDGLNEIVRMSKAKDSIVAISNEDGTYTNCRHIPVNNMTSYNGPGSLCLPATKTKCLVMEYRFHEVQFTDPRIIAVLASPPFHKGINRNNGKTSFGISSSNASGESRKFGFNVDFSIGGLVPVPPAGIGLKTLISNSFDWTATKTHEIKTAYSFSTPAGEDMVVFTVIPFDVYYYRVLNSPDKSAVGSTITVNIPNTPITTSAEVSYYNEHNGTFYDVETVILSHTAGMPSTYPSFQDMQKIQDSTPLKDGDKHAGLFTPLSSGLNTGEGSGMTSICIEDLAAVSSEFDYNLNTEISADISFIVVSIGTGLGFHYGYSYSTSVTSGTFIEGTVGNIPEEKYTNDLSYRWGIMAYPYYDESAKQKFTVVNYWVE